MAQSPAFVYEIPFLPARAARPVFLYFMLPWLSNPSPTQWRDVRDTSLAKLVHRDILAQILNGVLAPGQRINEPDVASRLQVSRVPVREALRELASSGLVVSRKHSGVFVRLLEPGEIRSLYQLRSLLDGFAGRSAAGLPPEQRGPLVARLEAEVQAMDAAASRHDVQAYYALNLRFHWVIVEASGNGPLIDTYRGIEQKLHLSRLKNLSQDMGMLASIAEHVSIVQALAQGDAACCEMLMVRHVSDAHERLLWAAPLDGAIDPSDAASQPPTISPLPGQPLSGQPGSPAFNSH